MTWSSFIEGLENAHGIWQEEQNIALKNGLLLAFTIFLLHLLNKKTPIFPFHCVKAPFIQVYMSHNHFWSSIPVVA